MFFKSAGQQYHQGLRFPPSFYAANFSVRFSSKLIARWLYHFQAWYTDRIPRHIGLLFYGEEIFCRTPISLIGQNCNICPYPNSLVRKLETNYWFRSIRTHSSWAWCYDWSPLNHLALQRRANNWKKKSFYCQGRKQLMLGMLHLSLNLSLILNDYMILSKWIIFFMSQIF